MKLAGLAVAVGLVISSPIEANDKHGGHEIEVGKYHVELVVKENDLALYVRGQGDKPIDPKTVKASANVMSAKDKAVVELKPEGPEALRGQAPFSVQKDAKVVVTFSVGGAKSEQARFSLGQKQDHKGHKH